MERADLLAWLRLSGADGIGPATARQLLARFGLPTAIFEQTASSLEAVLHPAQVRRLMAPQASLDQLVEATWQWVEAGAGCHQVIALGDPLYPKALLEIADPPLLLYAIGAADIWSSAPWPQRALAVVGSRNPSAQGSRNAHQFAQELAAFDVTVVSGLALGIDGAAHEGALAGSPIGLPTIAVVGTGLDRVYPARHRDLARRIATQGILLSEYPLGTPPLPHHFPQRNRILCGLAEGTLVVEAALQSGSLITARLCAEQGKDVFAIPGSIHSPLSKGCHSLIRQGAKLVESVQDIVEEFAQWAITPGGIALNNPPAPTQASEECAVLAALGHETSTLDQLQSRTGWATADLQVRLMELELQALVARLPGGSFERLHRA